MSLVVIASPSLPVILSPSLPVILSPKGEESKSLLRFLTMRFFVVSLLRMTEGETQIRMTEGETQIRMTEGETQNGICFTRFGHWHFGFWIYLGFSI